MHNCLALQQIMPRITELAVLYCGGLKKSFLQTVRKDRVIGLEGPTQMDKNGHVSIQGEALGGFSVRIKILWYPPTLST